MFARYALLFIFFLELPLAGCTYGNRIHGDVIAGPMSAIALTHVRPGAIAVLAGSEDEKTVSIFYDTAFGTEITRFPISPYATAVRETGTGKLAISVAPPRGLGAVELWSVSGRHLATFLMPLPILQLSRVYQGIAYGLVSVHKTKYAIRIHIADGRLSTAVRVPSDTESLNSCSVRGRIYLMTVSKITGELYLTDTVTGNRVDTGLQGERPVCLQTPPMILMLRRSPFTRSVQVLHLSKVAERMAYVVAPFDGIDMAMGQDGTVYILRLTGSDSQIQIWRRTDFAGV